MGDATKQRRSNFGLQIPDLLAERRLPDPDPGGSSREVPLLRDRQEITDVTELHIISKRNEGSQFHILEQ
jgi:hypothetical protein